MPLVDQVVSVNFGQGVDTKTNPKMVINGKMTMLQNCIFTQGGSLVKRNGYTALSMSTSTGGTITTPLMTKSYINELLCADGTSLYSYSPTSNAWVSKGNYQSISVKDQQLSVFVNNLSAQSVATLGNYVLAVYQADLGSGNYGAFASVLDTQTNSYIIQDFKLTSIIGSPRAILLSGSQLAVVGTDNAYHVYLQTVSISAGVVTFGSPVTLKTGSGLNSPAVADTSVSSTANYVYITSGGPSASAPYVVKVSSAGAVLATASTTFGNNTYPLIQQDVSGNVYCFGTGGTNPSSDTLSYEVFSSSLSVVKSQTTIASSLSYISSISSSVQSSGNLRIYYTTNTQAGNTTSANYQTTQYAVLSTSAVVSTNNLFLQNVEIQTKFTSYSGTNYAIFAHNPGNTATLSGDQNTFFLINEITGTAVAKCLYGRSIGFNDSYTQLRPDLIVNGTELLFGAPIIAFNDVANVSGTLTSSPIKGFSLVTFNFQDSEAYQGLEVANTAVLNGGIVKQYDGKTVAELGFNVFPENVVVTTATTGGSILPGTYAYAAVFEWYDANGNFHQSTPQEKEIVVPTGTSTNLNTITVQTISLTEKQNVVITLYRTVSTGTVYYKVGQTPNVAGSNYVTFTDSIPDTQINSVVDITLYTNGNVVDNTPPPPSMVMMSNQNRLWLVDSEHPTNTIWYSKTYNPGTGISMSDLLTITIDPSLGNITGLKGMDANTVVLKQNGILVFTGNGADDTGANSTISNPQVIPSDVGCATSKTDLIPGGLVFKSAKGIYMLNRSLAVEYVGYPVESFNSQNVTSIQVTPNATQLRFLTSSGSTLVYDYFQNQWSTFTNHQGYSGDYWNGTYIYARTDGSIYQENATSFLDGSSSYQLRAQTAWLKFAQVQGFQRVRRVAMLGDQTSLTSGSGHGLQVSAAYDFNANFSNGFSSPVPFVYSGTATPFQYRERLPIQKCESVQLLIEEIVTGASGESVVLNDLGMEVAIKKGLNKMSAGQSVG